MKPKHYLWVSLAAVSVALCFCVRTDLDDNTQQNDNADLTVAQAQAFFEKQVAYLGANWAGEASRGLIPGEFAVKWSEERFSSCNAHSNIEFAIAAQYAFQALRSEFVNGRARAYAVPAYQKLLVVKNTSNGHMSHYIMTIIPDRKYAASHRNFDPQAFTTYGDHDAFSGLIIYSTIGAKSWQVQVTRFRKGVKVMDHSLFKNDDRDTFWQIGRALKEITILRKNVATTRGFGEDNWYVDGGWIEDVIITPDWDGIGADGMTNDDWIENSRPGGWGDDENWVEPDTSDWENQDDSPFIDDTESTTQPNEDKDKNEEKTTIEYNDIKITGTDEEHQWTKNCINEILKTKIGQELLSKLSSVNIAIKCVDQIPGYPNASGLSHRNGSIDWITSMNGVLFEELFHQYQFNNEPTNQLRGNRELEAKCANAIGVNQGLFMGSSPETWDVYLNYVNNPSEENLQDAIDNLRDKDYSESKYPIDSSGDMLPHLNNLIK